MWRLTAWVAAAVALLTGLALLGAKLQTGNAAPLQSEELKQLKVELQQNPKSEPLKQHIRSLDLQLRQAHFRHLARFRVGTWLLAGSSVLFLLCRYQLAGLEKYRPRPTRRTGSAEERFVRTGARARGAVMVAGGVLGAGLLALSLLPEAPWPHGTAGAAAAPAGQPAVAAAATNDFPSQTDLEGNWPCFRGADGNGQSTATNLPIQWDVKSGAGIAWKVPVNADGFSSPITWGDRIFLSGGETNRGAVLCFDAQTGKELWRQTITNTPDPEAAGAPPLLSGPAAATMATDGRGVYALFTSGDLAAFALDGRPLWSKSFGPLKNAYGHASSLVTWHGRLIVQIDQGEAEDKKSRLYALEGRTGKILWQQPRQAPATWGSPIVIEAAGKAQIITLGLPWATSYAAADGAELWRVSFLNGEVLPSPTFAGGMVYLVSPAEKLIAVRPDGSGDVTSSQVLWTNDVSAPDIPSPVSNGELIFTVNSAGRMSAIDAKDGKPQWEHDFEMEINASPALAANRVYLFSANGTALVVAAERKFQQLFRCDMSDPFHASPAFLSDGMIVRGATNLWKLTLPRKS